MRRPRDLEPRPEELPGLTVKTPAQFSGGLHLTVTAVETASDGNSATVSVPVAVTVQPPPVAPPVLSMGAATGLEGQPIALDIGAGIGLGAPSETLSVTIAGVPAGASLSAGTNAGNGVWTLTGAELAGLHLTPPAHSDAGFTLSVTATASDGSGGQASVSSSLPVTVIAVADTPVVAAVDVSGAAGSPLPLDLTAGLPVTEGHETVTVLLSGVPVGFALNHGCNNGDNTWTVTQAELSGLALVAPPGFNGQVTLHAQAMAHDDGHSIALGAATAFTAGLGDHAGGYQVDLGAGAHAGGIGAGVQAQDGTTIDVYPVTGGLTQAGGIFMKEDVPCLLADAPQLLDVPALNGLTSLVAKVDFTGIPADVTFSAGTDKGGGVWEFTAAELLGLRMNTPPDADSDFTISAVAKMTLGLPDIPLATTAVHVQGIADLPALTASAGLATEDTAIALNIAGASTATGHAETVDFTVSGLPTGFALNHGVDNGNGTWSLQAGDLAGLTITPAHDFSGRVDLTVGATATVASSPGDCEGASVTRQVAVSLDVAAVADAPILHPPAAIGLEGQAVALDLGLALSDRDGSEHIGSVTVGGLPVGATLSAGVHNNDGTYTLTAAQLAGLSMTPAAHWHGDANLTVTATSEESTNGSSATVAATLPVHIEAVANTPVVHVADATGVGGAPIALHLNATATDPGEHVSTVLSGVPQDVMLSAGLNNGDGSWTLTPQQLGSVQVTTAARYDGDLHMLLTAYSREDNGSIASASQGFGVHVTAAEHAGSWIEASTTGQVAATAEPAHIATEALDAAEVSAHAAGSDYQHAFQGHHTG